MPVLSRAVYIPHHSTLFYCFITNREEREEGQEGKNQRKKDTEEELEEKRKEGGGVELVVANPFLGKHL